MINIAALEKMSDAQLAEMVKAHERDMQIYRNSRRVGIWITREISQGAADAALAILRRRKDDAKVTKIG